jgi:hypothetical protein
MLMRVIISHQLGLLDDYGPEEIKRDEESKLKATMLADLFWWHLLSDTGFQFAGIYQRSHEGKMVLVGLPPKEAQAFVKKRREAAQQMAWLIGSETQKPRLVN